MSFHPQTPQSPMQFSPATASDPLHGSSNPMVVAATASTTLLTPAHSVNGSSASQPDMAMVEDSPHKRKRPVDDLGGDRDQKKAYAEKIRSAIEGLHRDVGSKYLLLHSPHPESLPRTSEDLYEMFGLVGLAAEVAREKPNGEKNALRKTYKGHIKRLGVAGHFDVQKKQEDAPSDFMAMLQVPELEWNVHQVKGREITDGLSDLTLSNLGRALTMAKGPVANEAYRA
ncbi:Mediator of RNA polymerase II transcription subunit 19 [Escovopsis weberi]|uniref:Mediator of RNA polymerase II transcription subunit 19 n=1 Tax=Escovopsis weberi TaxID=150374 RepID=A0A0M8MXY3_ESCWE|nr:Mediator of RNA polymerase II transcription subunit 19 [Escovopsis weberi]